MTSSNSLTIASIPISVRVNSLAGSLWQLPAIMPSLFRVYVYAVPKVTTTVSHSFDMVCALSSLSFMHSSNSSLLLREKSLWCIMLCHLPPCSRSSGDFSVNGVPSAILLSTADIENGLYCTPNGLHSMLNFLSCSFLPMLPAKQDPTSMMWFLCEISISLTGNSTFVENCI